ncbi:leucine--tRNA ligase [bacterium]|nr:leucine--tRNA ligase [bacterium]
MKEYCSQEIEPKWQEFWLKNKTFKALVPDKSKKPKFYVLDMFPYPSGAGLHVGHPRGYTATDIVSRMKKMQGFNVLHPMGWDAFGLPAENYALKHKIHPEKITAKNIQRFKKQLISFGFAYDWDREINTTDPGYYRWTQWIFLQLFKHGLAYQAETPINFCPSCGTGLANEEVVNGRCERCQTKVIRKKLRQWLLKITAYAERLLKDLDDLDWPEYIKEMQKNWIGKSEGATIKFKVKNSSLEIEVFTTRPDTLFGATYVVLAPEHPLSLKLATPEYKEKVKKYIHESEQKTELERTELSKEKTGVFTGSYAINPVNNKPIPIWIADYVLAHYATGAIMCVPAHDQRDFDFAKKYDLPIIQVIAKNNKPSSLKKAYEKKGILINSGKFSQMPSEKAKKEIVKWLASKNLAQKTITYKLRDWIFSRQRYWGEPIPVIHCPKCGTVPLKEKDLPLKLPYVKHYEPSGTGESPLVKIKDWVNTTCPKCGAKAKRETNTMPQWAGSSWYYLCYIDPKNNKQLVAKNKEKYFMPVDLYVGGAEHAVLHLLYARFWHKFLYDIGAVSTKEPFQKLINVGIILAPDGRKMSKSLGNVINPDSLIKKYGADAFRLYEAFIGPFRQSSSWDPKGIVGTKRFLDKVWRLIKNKERKKENKQIEQKLHQLIKVVSQELESFEFNTAIAKMMEFVHLAEKEGLTKKEKETFLKLLAPFAPHIAEELWLLLGNQPSIFESDWPKYSQKIAQEKEITIIIQANGKTKGSLKAPFSCNQKTALEIIQKSKFSPLLKESKKQIFVRTPKKPIAIFNIIQGSN